MYHNVLEKLFEIFSIRIEFSEIMKLLFENPVHIRHASKIQLALSTKNILKITDDVDSRI